MLTLLPAAVLSAQTPAPAKPATAAPKPAAAKPAVRPVVKPAAPAAVKPPTTDDEKAIYAIGVSMFERISQQFDLSPQELELCKKGFSDAASKKQIATLDQWGPLINNLAQERQKRVVERKKAESVAFLAKAATEPLAVKMPSGIIYRELTPGSGRSPSATDTVKVNYRGTLVDGTEFDSSYKRNEPATFPLDHVIRCWTEGLQKMKVGGKAKLVCPSDLAYGDQGRPGIPPASVLIFEIELLEIGGPAPGAGSGAGAQ
ncbi:MAG TPA: FKBP-type peptidyl-prolyl cis-trans isomerase [Bryobacteraceae bacterium]